MYPGWLSLGSGDPSQMAPYIEVVNNARAYAYARNMGLCWLKECEPCDTSTLIIPPGGDYRSPMLDPAPWFDPNNMDTAGFLGVIGLDIQGDVNSTRAVTTKNAVTFGGVLGPPYFGPRTLVVRCLAVALDDCALQAGLNWLQFFAAMPEQPCLGDDLTFFDCCPCLCPDEPEPHCWAFNYGELATGPPCAGSGASVVYGPEQRVTVGTGADGQYITGGSVGIRVTFAKPGRITKLRFSCNSGYPSSHVDLNMWDSTGAKAMPTFRSLKGTGYNTVTLPAPVTVPAASSFTFSIHGVESATVPYHFGTDQGSTNTADCTVNASNLYTDAIDVRPTTTFGGNAFVEPVYEPEVLVSSALWPKTYTELMVGPYVPAWRPTGEPFILEEPFNNLDAWTKKVGGPKVVDGGRLATALSLSAGQQISFRLPVADETDVMTMGCAMKTTAVALGTNSQLLFRSDDAATNHCALRWNAAGGLELVRGSTIIAGPTVPGLITANEWHYVEVQVKLGDAPDGFVIVRHNDVEVLNVHGIDTRGTGTKLGFDTLQLIGLSGGPPPVGNVILFDDMYIKGGADKTFEGDHLIPPDSPWCGWPVYYFGLIDGPPPCCIDECIIPYVRQYYNVMVTAGPTVLQQPAMTQGAMAEFELTLVCANPAKHMLPDPYPPLPGSDVGVVTSAVGHLPSPPDPFAIPGVTTMQSIANVLTREAPPVPFDLPSRWERQQIELTSGRRGGTALTQMAPLINVRSYADQAEFVRVGVWAGEHRVAGWLIPFMPPSTSLTIDVAHRQVVSDRGGEVRTLPSFVRDWDGGPMGWPELPHGTYRVTIDQEENRAVQLMLRASSVQVS